MQSVKNKIRGFWEILKFDNRLDIIIQTLLYPHQRLFIYCFKGKEYIVDKKAGDLLGFRSIIATNEYQPYLKILNLTQPISVVDLGANVGGFPALLHSMGISIKKYVAVEFNPSVFRRLSFNIERNWDFEYMLVNAAIVGFPRKVTIHRGHEGTGVSIYEQLDEGQQKVLIESITFDQLFLKYFDLNEAIDLLKIDIEGAEAEMFESDSSTKIKNAKAILIEIHDLNKAQFIIKKLISNGYEKSKNISCNKNVFLFIRKM